MADKASRDSLRHGWPVEQVPWFMAVNWKMVVDSSYCLVNDAKSYLKVLHNGWQWPTADLGQQNPTIPGIDLVVQLAYEQPMMLYDTIQKPATFAFLVTNINQGSGNSRDRGWTDLWPVNPRLFQQQYCKHIRLKCQCFWPVHRLKRLLVNNIVQLMIYGLLHSSTSYPTIDQSKYRHC